MSANTASEPPPLTIRAVWIAVAVEMFPAIVALTAGILSLGLWVYYRVTSGDIDRSVALFAYSLLAVAFLFGGFGWTLTGRSGVGCAVFLARIVIVGGLLYSGLAGLFGDSGAAGVAMFVFLGIGVAASATSACMIARIELPRAQRR